ncbi:ABC-type transport system involved in multi-copper enzyme maturation permease subunit [Neomicrococcus aestuarii]|uniref:ABC-type transport system involved in multi-copper enzyme maturation permease subunit n=1 Tax=Neomicrococcus aestuarii TaxID=556325 RepID=A0A7W8WZN5_9MICC|nr:ABC transporter permease subunit [Neomicrococcus aestuarii]MBB5512510.1 ABC-type transport system involved in multi-copper enzyme maturation permease subunit [Neomicrococcus aestuarii]
MSQALDTERNPVGVDGTLGFKAGIRTVFKMELMQRLRSGSWYWMMGVWFVIIGLVTWAVIASFRPYDEYSMFGGQSGQLVFETVLFFVLLFALLISPAFAANTITGDRQNGTLAIIQNTLLTPWQIILGKWLAAWVSALAFLVVALPFIVLSFALGGVDFSRMLLFILMLGFELLVMTGLGVAVSSVSVRSLFAVLGTYLLVALFSVGTLIGFGLSAQLSQEEVSGRYMDAPIMEPPAEVLNSSDGKAINDWYNENSQCSTATQTTNIVHTERIAWILAANPFVMVADIAREPYDVNTVTNGELFTGISQLMRSAQAGPEYQHECLNGKKFSELPDPQVFPSWPIGMAIQVIFLGGLMTAARNRLKTPVKKLSPGMRVA